jgi:hypothetical protein
MKPKNVGAHVHLVLAGAGLAAAFSLLLQSSSYTIISHGFRMFGASIFRFLGLWIVFSLALIGGARVLIRWEVKTTGGPPGGRFRETAWAATPLLVLLLSPTLHANYLTRGDLRSRVWILVGLALTAAVYLKGTSLRASPENRPGFFRRVLDRFHVLPVRRRLVLLFLAAFAVYCLCAFIIVREGVTFSGDEPNYLLTSHSLVYDGDINVFNNHAGRDYFHFYARKDNPRLKMGIYARQGKRGQGHIYPINLPGTSALLAPFYWLSQQVEEGFFRTFILKVSLAVWAVLLGLQLYLLARDLWRRDGLALGLWALYAFSTPVLFYAVHLYPEIPIALFSIYIYRMVRSDRRIGNGHLLLFGLLLGTFFWFGLKYNLIFWPLLGISAFHLWKTHRLRARILWMVGPALLGLASFYYAVWDMYGTLSPFAVYEGAITADQAKDVTNAFLGLPLITRIESFLDYFLDQRDGLFLYAPFYVFAILGLIEMARRARREFIGLGLIAAPFVLNYAFFTHRQGYCPQARVLAPLSWIGAVAIGYFWVHNRRRFYRWAFGLSAAAAAAITTILVRHPEFLYQPTTHDYTSRAGDIFVHLSNIRFFLPQYLPSFLKIRNIEYWPNYVWVAALAVFVIAYLATKNEDRGRRGRRFHAGAAALFLGAGIFIWVLYPRPALYPSRPVRYSSGGSLGFYAMPMGRGVVTKDDGRMYLHFEKSYRFLFSSLEPVKDLRLVYGSEKGEHEVRMRFFDLPLLEAKTSREMKETVFAPAAFFRLRDLYVYDLTVELKKFSDENLLEDPHLVQIIPLK